MKKYILFLSVLSFILIGFVGLNVTSANAATTNNSFVGTLQISSTESYIKVLQRILKTEIFDAATRAFLNAKNVVSNPILSIEPNTLIVNQNTNLTLKIKNALPNTEIIFYITEPGDRPIGDDLGETDNSGTFTISDQTSAPKVGIYTFWVVIGGFKSNVVNLNVLPVSAQPSNTVVISGVSGPQSLNVNQQGTWTVRASSSNGGNLSYSVVWGDEGQIVSKSQSHLTIPVQQSATFTHTYSQAGIYTPSFKVANSSGQDATTSLSVNVGNVIPPVTCPVGKICNPHINSVTNPISPGQTMSIEGINLNGIDEFGKVFIDNISPANVLVDGAKDGSVLFFVLPNLDNGQHSLYVENGSASVKSNVVTFRVQSVTQTTITVLKPNGGESLSKGSSYSIKWSQEKSAYVDIRLQEISPTCSNLVTNCNHPLYNIARNISYPIGKNDYTWIVGNVLDEGALDGVVRTYVVPNGTYKIQVCYWTGDEKGCDSSNNYLTIITAPTIQPSITVLSPNGGEEWRRGEIKNITWKSNQLGKNVNIELRHFPLQPNPTDAIVIANNVVNNGNYSWNVGQFILNDSRGQNGNYLMEVCTIGVRGLCDQSDYTFKIISGNSTQSSIAVLSPNGGETFEKGKQYTIAWSVSSFRENRTSFGLELLDVQNNPVSNFAVINGVPFQGTRQIVLGQGTSNSYQIVLSNTIPDGSYKFRVSLCPGDGAATICLDTDINNMVFDVSNSTFNIISPVAKVNQPPVITSIEGGSTSSADQSATWYWHITASDPDGSDFTYSIHWGDETAPISVTPSYSNEDNATASVSHRFSAPGTYTITFAVGDGKGGTASEQRTITIPATATGGSSGGSGSSPKSTPINQSPVISSISGAENLTVNQEATWTMTASDPDGSAFTYAVHWGDDTAPISVNAVSDSNGTNATVDVTHSFSTPGTYTITFAVGDGKGGTVSEQRTVTVSVASAE